MLVALNGLKGSGKDAFAKFLVDNYGFHRVAFADPLKESAAALFSVEPSLWDELKNDETAKIVLIREVKGDLQAIPVSARVFLQRYGTEAHRSVFYDDFWVDASIPNESETYDEWAAGRDIVITDARFPNELKRVRDLGGTIVRIERPGLESNDLHVSEILPPDVLIDETIVNGGDLSDLEVMADLFIARIINLELKGTQLNLFPSAD